MTLPVDIEVVQIVCLSPSHPTMRAVVGMIGRNPQTDVVEPSPVTHKGMVGIQRLNDDRPYKWLDVTHDDIPSDEKRVRVQYRCPLCPAHLVRRWPDPRLEQLVRLAIKTGVSSIPLAYLVANLT